jgi:hypothetical protein
MQTATGDYAFGSGQQNFFIDSPAGVGQIVQTGMLLWEGEWYLNTTEGMPTLEGIMGYHSQATADLTVQNQISNTEFVTDIASFASTIDPDTRAYSVTTTIDTVFGQTQVEMQNIANL